MAADRTPNELADRLSIEHQHPSPSGKIGLCQCPRCPDLRAAAVLLRRQGEQLDTLRAERDALLEAIGEHYRYDGHAMDSCCNADYRLWWSAAAAVPQDPERCACGKPATGTVGGVPTCGDDR